MTSATNRLHPIGLAVAAALLLGVWHFARLPGDGPLIGPLHSAAHFPLFGLLAVIVFIALRRFATPGRQNAWGVYGGTLLVMLVISGVTEWSQQFTARNASLWDVAVNMAGTVAALALIALYDRQVAEFTQTRLRTLSLALLPVILAALVLLPVAGISAALMKRDADFPCLVCPKNRVDLWMIDRNGASVRLAAGPDRETYLEILMETSAFPGVSWEWPVKDWRGFDALELELGNPGPLPLDLTLRIDDLHHNFRFTDRFNQRITLEAGSRSRECIPLTDLENAPEGRQMDLSGIARLMLFGSEASHGSRFRIYGIRLIRHQEMGSC
ncbi:VanZ family protein [Thioalkalivibrio sulfidiphilus]|uniref:VanZ family protein n=1 Tax=Thioalkalivibrio sulfidiphilus TaxID=1033854 RepID=UPI000361AE19|nr:VanZ family protein [Thioalkalivibrio sulfidiphilus]